MLYPDEANNIVNGYGQMHIRISEGDISAIHLQGGDMRRFLRILGEKDTVGKDAATGAEKPNPFDEVHIGTSWGLVIFTFYAPGGAVTKALNLDLLLLTRELVISNDGVPIDRYESVVDELLLQAKDQLLTGKKLPIVLPKNHPPAYEVKA